MSAAPLSRGARIASWLLQLVAAAILAQTLFFKFSAAPESVYIFTTLGMDPGGRIGTGSAELVAVVLLLVPRTAVFGAVLAMSLMAGAIVSHATKLGLDVQGDGGTLFTLAVATFAAAAGIAWLRRRDLPVIGAKLAGAP